MVQLRVPLLADAVPFHSMSEERNASPGIRPSEEEQIRFDIPQGDRSTKARSDMRG